MSVRQTAIDLRTRRIAAPLSARKFLFLQCRGSLDGYSFVRSLLLEVWNLPEEGKSVANMVQMVSGLNHDGTRDFSSYPSSLTK